MELVTQRNVLIAHDHRDATAWQGHNPELGDVLVLTAASRVADRIRGVEPVTVFVTPFAVHHPYFRNLYSVVRVQARAMARRRTEGE